MTSKAESYRQLMERFLRREVTAMQFKATFLSSFKSEPAGMAESLYLALDRLFSDVDMFCADDELHDDDDLDEDGLRRACKNALAQIAEL